MEGWAWQAVSGSHEGSMKQAKSINIGTKKLLDTMILGSYRFIALFYVFGGP